MHSIVKQLSPSDEQKPAIIARGQDVAVTAGAGTGKTRTLAARYLSLLADGLPLRSIVAITFTQKAAREMRNRVRETLRKFIDRGVSDDTEHTRWLETYSALDAARISTIHSLCAEILVAHPAEAGIDPRFEVLDEGQMAALRGQAVTEGLAWAANEPNVALLFALISPYQLDAFLNTLLAQTPDAKDIFATLPSTSILVHWQKMLADAQDDARRALLACSEWQSAIAFLRDTHPLDGDDKMAIQRALVLRAVDDEDLRQLDAINLSGGAGKNWAGGKNTVTDVKDAIKTIRTQWKTKRNILMLAVTEHDETLATAMPLLQNLFEATMAQYERAKTDGHALDFDDLETKTLALLCDYPAVRNHWQTEIQALLVDEFQDTNARQRDLLNYLDGGAGKRFIVGDAKQSIYRFRGADVSVFRAERDAIRAGGGQHIALDTSYRAHADLILGMNSLLSPILGTDADPAQPWYEPFSPLKPARSAPHTGFVAPHIEFHLTAGSKNDGALHRAADAVVARLAALVDSTGIGFGDIAILCRASSSFGAYEDALEKASIPFVTVAGGGFYNRPEIRDILNALAAIADPTDNLALAGFLRSPIIGVSDSTLFRLFGNRTTETDIVWQNLPNLAKALADDEHLRIKRAVTLLETFHKQTGRIPVSDLLKRFLDATDYLAVLLHAGQKRAERNVRKLLNDAHTGGLVGVEEFLIYVGDLRDRGSREGEARAIETGALQIMSIHAAKGLEFSVVVVGDVGYKSPNRNRVLFDSALGILLPLKDGRGELSAIYHLGKARDAMKETAETKRLLYVAATRAEEKLIFSGTLNISRQNKLSSGGWLKTLMDEDNLQFPERIAYNEDGENVIEIPLKCDDAMMVCHIYEPNVVFPTPMGKAPSPLKDNFSLSPLLLPIKTKVATEPMDDTPPRVWRVVPSAARVSAPAWVVGQAVHAALAQWRFPDDVKFSTWAAGQFRNAGLLDEKQITDGMTRARQILARFQHHPLYQMMNSAARRLHEVPYIIEVNGEPENGVIDALYLHEKQWTIVE